MEVQTHRAAAGLHSLLGLSAPRGGRQPAPARLQHAPPFLGVLAAAVSRIGHFWGLFGKKVPAEIPPLELPVRRNAGTLEVCGVQAGRARVVQLKNKGVGFTDRGF